MADNWRSESDRRIERLRKGDFRVTCVHANGKPLRATDVRVRQTGHAFHFGMAVSSKWPPGADGRRYGRFIAENFNCAVTENALKWYGVERQKGRLTFGAADRILTFCQANGLALRGHCVFWAKPRFTQDWIQDLDDEALRARIDRHIREVVPRYAGKLLCWDVNNEMLDGRFFAKRLGPDIRAHMFREIHKLDPNTPLFVNEYGIMNSDAKTARYLKLIRDLQDRGAPVGGIGVQEHGAAGYGKFLRGKPGGLRPGDVWKRLDRLAGLGLPIHLTEISSKTPDDELRADTLECIFRVGFAHPGVEAVLLWGFWAGRHWMGPDAALVDRDWTVNPAGERIVELLNRTWRTRADATTDGAGLAAFRGFYGTYEFGAAGPGGKRITGTCELTRDGTEARVVLR